MNNILSRAAFVASVVVAGVMGGWLSSGNAVAQDAAGIPIFEVDPSWPKVPPKWKMGDVSSIAVDAQGNVYLLHRPRTMKPEEGVTAAPPVMVFDVAGNFIRAWGGDGAAYEWPQREHGIHIDYKGHVWLGGNNCPTNKAPGTKPLHDDQVLKFTLDGKFVMQIGRSDQSKGNADTLNFHRPADAWVHPKSNELYVADGYGNRRVAVFDADTGKFKRMWGAFGNKPTDDDSCAVRSRKEFPDGPGPDQFNIAHAIRVSNDGIVYVADRENRRLQSFTLEGKFIKQLYRYSAPFARSLAFSHDAAQRYIYVGGGKDIVVVERKTLEIATTISGGGLVQGGHQIASDARGNIYVAQTAQGIQKLNFKGYGNP